MNYPIFADYKIDPNLSFEESLIFCGVALGGALVVTAANYVMKRYFDKGSQEYQRRKDKELSDKLKNINVEELDVHNLT